MLATHHALRAFCATSLFLVAGSVAAQTYPAKPIRIVTPTAGSSVDFISRLVAQAISGPLGQQVIVDNRPSGVAPGQAVAQAAPDGYTFVVSGSNLWIGQLLQSVPYDAERDFSPVSILGESPLVLIVHPSLPARTVSELIALAKARPAELNYASSAAGTASHLAGELFKSMAAVSIVNVPYKNAAQGISDLIGGQVHMTFDGGSTLKPHIAAGKLRALGVTSARPTPLFPGVPTVASTGLPGYEWTSQLAMFAPAKTPGANIARLHQEIVRALALPDVREKLLNVGIEPVGSSPEQLAALVKSAQSRLGKVIKDAGIRID